MRMTPTHRKVLQDAISDGGAVELLGIDKRPGYTRRHYRAAADLQGEGLGFVRMGSLTSWHFEINAAGRKAVSQ